MEEDVVASGELDALNLRLLRRAYRPIGVVDVEQARGHCMRLLATAAKHDSLLQRLHARRPASVGEEPATVDPLYAKWHVSDPSSEQRPSAVGRPALLNKGDTPAVTLAQTPREISTAERTFCIRRRPASLSDTVPAAGKTVAAAMPVSSDRPVPVVVPSGTSTTATVIPPGWVPRQPAMAAAVPRLLLAETPVLSPATSDAPTPLRSTPDSAMPLTITKASAQEPAPAMVWRHDTHNQRPNELSTDSLVHASVDRAAASMPVGASSTPSIPAAETASTLSSRPMPQPAPPPAINVSRLADQVSRLVLRKLSIDLERKGVRRWL